VLLLFGLGLEFSWQKIREVGLSVLVIGGLEIITMISLGYGLGRIMGWSHMDSIFLGAALHISSSAIIIKILRDMGRLHHLSSRLIVGILVVEDFAAITIIAILSGVSSTGMASFGDIGALILKLAIFVISSLVFGALIVPRIIKFTHRFQSKEALLIISLGLCFAMALLGRYLGLSVAVGAFIMGSLIGETEQSEEITEIVAPVRDMFAALFFVTIGMLINITMFRDFLVPAIIVSVVFTLGKIISNTAATFVSGHDSKTCLQVGTGMPQMGEFSLVITKVGVDRAIVAPFLYPVIALSTAITSVTAPYIARSSDIIISVFNRVSPVLLKTYISRLSDWLEALRATFSRDSIVAHIIRHAIKTILINLLIIMVLIGIGTYILRFITDLPSLFGIRTEIIGLSFGFLILLMCIPSFIIIWQHVRNLVNEAAAHMLSRRLSSKALTSHALRIVFRDSIGIALAILIALWFIPFITGLFSIGSLALAMPALFGIVVLYLILRFSFDIHTQLERTFSRTLLGKEHVSRSKSTIRDSRKNIMTKLLHKIKRTRTREKHDSSN
jgi:Kef-type K+ transport system membrane component KefB